MWSLLILSISFAVAFLPTEPGFARRAIAREAVSRRIFVGSSPPVAAAVFGKIPVREDVRPSAALSSVDRVYGASFVDYLCRILLTWDSACSFWWAAQQKKPMEQKELSYERFRSSVVLGLARSYDGDPERLLNDLAQKRKSLVDKRQLALCFSLAKKQPTDGISMLVAQAENRSVAAVEIIDGGSYDHIEEIEASFDGSRLRLETTGRVREVRVTSGSPTAITAEEPSSKIDGRRRATFETDDKKGQVRVLDPGFGYDKSPRLAVENGTAEVAMEYEILAARIADSSSSGGYSSPPPELIFSQGRRTAKGRIVLTEEIYDSRAAPSSSSSSILLAQIHAPPKKVGRRWVFAEAPVGTDDELMSVRGLQTRARPSPEEYAKIFACGALCSAAANVALTPLGVIKTKLQINSSDYSDLFAGADTVAAGSFVAGAANFGVSTLARDSLPADSFATVVLASLAGAALSAPLAAPFENARVRAMTSSNLGLVAALRSGPLFASIDAILARDVTYGVVCFSAFDATKELIYRRYPFLTESFAQALGAASLAGLVAGLLASLVTQPADAAFTKMTLSASSSPPDDEKEDEGDQTKAPRRRRRKSQSVFRALGDVYARGGLDALFTGAPARAALNSANIGLQCIAFELLTKALQVSTDDFAYSLDVLSGVAAVLPPPATTLVQ